MITSSVIAHDEWLVAARETLLYEAEAIQLASARLNGNLLKAVEIILNHHGKIVVTALGKSGHIAQKVAATLTSTGTPAVFLHAADALHGDLGIYTPGDPTIVISKSGTTAEVVRLMPLLRQFASPLIGILGNLKCELAQQIDVVLDASVAREADRHNMVPTCSSTVALALGDALATTLMTARQFSDRDFARYHPSGQLGRNLWLRVSDVMHTNSSVAKVSVSHSLRDVVIAMSAHALGAACVVDDQDHLLGIITDGDLRRALQLHDDIRLFHASDIMTTEPTTIGPEAHLNEALSLMEDRPSQISVLPVVDTHGRCLGLLRIHDVYQPGRA